MYNLEWEMMKWIDLNEDGWDSVDVVAKKYMWQLGVYLRGP